MTTTNWPGQQAVVSAHSEPPPPQGSPPPSGAPLTQLLWGSSSKGPVIGRGAVFAVLATVVTFGLAMALYEMIKYRDSPLEEDTGYRNANFIRLKEESTVNRRTRELPKKELKKETPQTPTLNVKSSQSRKIDTTALKIDVPNTPAFTGKLSLVGGPGIGKGTIVRDQEMMPFARVKPVYPPDAHDRGIEGWVDLVFTVTKKGSVRGPKVVQAEPPSVFNRSAIQAVKKWKYRPKIVDGQPVDVPGVTARVKFDINDP